VSFVWDYNKSELVKTKSGRILLLERMINFGPEENEKISLSKAKKYWDKLNLFPKRKRLMELLIWGKIRS
jgi:hypothetical protein